MVLGKITSKIYTKPQLDSLKKYFYYISSYTTMENLAISNDTIITLLTLIFLTKKRITYSINNAPIVLKLIKHIISAESNLKQIHFASKKMLKRIAINCDLSRTNTRRHKI